MSDLSKTVSNYEVATLLPVNTWFSKVLIGKVVFRKGTNLNSRITTLLKLKGLEKKGTGAKAKYRMTEEMRLNLLSLGEEVKQRNNPTRFFVKNKAQAEIEAHKQAAEMLLKQLKWI